MKKKFKIYFLSMIMPLIFSWNLIAQAPINSPLTFIGLGEIHPDDLQNRRYSGYTSTAAFGSYEGNIRNPAALGRLMAANFDVGLTLRSIQLSRSDASTEAWYGNFDYLLLSFPIFNPINDVLNRDIRKFRWGMMLGIKPYSNIGYNINSHDFIADETEVLKQHNGKGGTYKFFWGNGFTYEEFSVGFRLEYILGEMDFNVHTGIADEPYSFTTKQERNLYLKAFNYDVGVQYNIVFHREMTMDGTNKGNPIRYLNLGLSTSSKIKADFTQDILTINQSTVGNIVDTISQQKNVSGSGFLPGHIDAGLMYRHNEILTISADFKHDAWSKYVNPFEGQSAYKLKDSYRYGIGVEYVPEPGALDGYLKKVKYFVGGHYGNDPRVINGEQLTDYGMSTGLTLPFIGRARRAYATISLFYNRKAASDFTEDYFGFGLSFKGTDNQWFVKSKFN